jgi:MFS family permease
MARALRSVKTFKKSWDADKALKSTYKGKFGKHQLRAYIFLALGYAIIIAWLTEMPAFALLPPKHFNCSTIAPNETNTTVSPNETTTTVARTVSQKSTTVRTIVGNLSNTSSSEKVKKDGRIKPVDPIYNYSREYGRTVLTDFNKFCEPLLLKIPRIVYLIGLILGGLIFGYIADHSGRKMILIGSMWTACALSIFQLLSEDFISYVFFMLFVGMAIGAVQVITVPYVIEMFPIESRAIYGLSLTAAAFLFDLIMPGFGFAIKNWKILQGVVSLPLIITAALYWFAEESMFWYTTQKDYVTAVVSLTKIARFNGIVFEDIFREARDFLRGKRSKGIQCDFQPLLRLEDIQLLGSKYPDFDMVDLQATTGKKNSCSQRLVQVLTGHHYYPTLSTFYPTDYLHSSILSIYLLVMCGLWLVSSLTEYSLESTHLTKHLTDDYFLNYFLSHLIQIGSFIVAFPMVYIWGRRWPTFCFFLIAEVCLLGSVTVRPDVEETRVAMLVVYFLGKFACRGGFIVILLYTCEIFPTGLRCTTLGICYTFRLIGVALASQDVAGLNDRMPRLVYGILALVLGSMALLLPETKKFPLPRTIVQVEMIPASVSKKFRRYRSAPVKRNARSDGTRHDGANQFNDGASSISGVRSVRFGPYDNQSTLHSVYEMQECVLDDTIHSSSGRYARRADLRNPTLFQPSNIETYRQQTPIAEDGEYDEDVDDDRTRYAQQQRRTEHQQRFNEQQLPILRSDSEVVASPNTKQSSNESPSQLETTAQIQAGDVTGDRNGTINSPPTTEESTEKAKQDDNLSPTPTQIFDETNTYPPPNISEEENYFSEHC